MSETVQGGARRSAFGYPDSGVGSGRHAFDEDAALTPIFHALSRSGWRDRQRDPGDEVDQFRRDPLTAPIPVQAMVPEPTRPATYRRDPVRERYRAAPPTGGEYGHRDTRGAHSLVEPRRSDGRHHHQLEPAGRW